MFAILKTVFYFLQFSGLLDDASKPLRKSVGVIGLVVSINRLTSYVVKYVTHDTFLTTVPKYLILWLRRKNCQPNIYIKV